MNLKHYKAASEKTDEAERGLIPPFTTPKPVLDDLKQRSLKEREKYDHDAESEATLHEELKSLRAHKLRLDRELPEMRKENQRLTGFIQDAAAYVRWAFNEGHRQDVILSNLVHDLRGLANDEPCFSPRVTGYASREREGRLS